jgi:hypothetical protein
LWTYFKISDAIVVSFFRMQQLMNIDSYVDIILGNGRIHLIVKEKKLYLLYRCEWKNINLIYCYCSNFRTSLYDNGFEVTILTHQKYVNRWQFGNNGLLQWYHNLRLHTTDLYEELPRVAHCDHNYLCKEWLLLADSAPQHYSPYSSTLIFHQKLSISSFLNN